MEDFAAGNDQRGKVMPADVACILFGARFVLLSVGDIRR